MLIGLILIAVELVLVFLLAVNGWQLKRYVEALRRDLDRIERLLKQGKK